MKEISGNWKGVFVEQGSDRYSICFTFELFNEKLFGTVRYATGEGQIQNGKIDGDRISFITKHLPQFGENQAIIRFEGILKGEQIDFLMQNDINQYRFTAMRTAFVPAINKRQDCLQDSSCVSDTIKSIDPCPEWKS